MVMRFRSSCLYAVSVRNRHANLVNIVKKYAKYKHDKIMMYLRHENNMMREAGKIAVIYNKNKASGALTCLLLVLFNARMQLDSSWLE